MNQWPTVALGELAADVPYACIGGPFGSELTTRDYVQTPGVPIIRGSNLGEDGFVDDRFVYISERKALTLRGNQARPGDIVFTQRGTIGQIAIIPSNARYRCYVLSQSQMKLTPDRSRLEPRFLLHYFRSGPALSFLARNTLATGVPHINLGILRSAPVPLPPLPEQRRIAEILDKADALRAKRRAALAQLDTLTQSIFLDMFGDAGENPKAWPVRCVSEYVAEFQGGKSIESESGDNVATRNRVLKVSAVTGMVFLTHECKPVPDSYTPPFEHFVRPGDLLFSRANTAELVGAVAYVERTPQNLLLPDKLWRFVWRQPAIVEPLFVWALFQTPALRREIGRRATGTSGSMKNISQEKVLGIATICPPVALQKEFTKRLAAVENVRVDCCASAKEIDAIFHSLQHLIFRGELLPCAASSSAHGSRPGARPDRRRSPSI